MIWVAISFGASLLLLSFIINHLYWLYTTAKLYPPGPVPLPVFGNLLNLIRNRKVHPFVAIHLACRPYGKVTTFHFGSKPAVIITDLEIGKNVFNQLECSGRPQMAVALIASGENFKSFWLQDYSVSVKLHRKLALEAIRQLLSSQRLSSLVNEIVSETIDIIASREESKPFSPDLYLPQIPLRILSELTFGVKYKFDDTQLMSIEHSLKAFNNETMKLLLVSFLPVSKYFVRGIAQTESEISALPLLYEKCFENRNNSFKVGNCDNFADCLLTSRIKMLEEKRDDSKYLTDNDLIGVLAALFVGLIDSSLQAFNWLILLIAYYTEMQQKLRSEISEQLGNDRFPQLEDRKNCHYVNAFIHEALRFRPLVPIGFPHTTLSDTTIGNYKIPKDTMIFLDLLAILHDPLYWKSPEKFSPERFLDSSDLFVSSRFPAFIAFGSGKRMCPGFRMAVDMLFLEVVCLLRATNGYQFELANGSQNGDLDVWSYPTLLPQPKPFKIILKQL